MIYYSTAIEIKLLMCVLCVDDETGVCVSVGFLFI